MCDILANRWRRVLQEHAFLHPPHYSGPFANRDNQTSAVRTSVGVVAKSPACSRPDVPECWDDRERAAEQTWRKPNVGLSMFLTALRTFLGFRGNGRGYCKQPTLLESDDNAFARVHLWQMRSEAAIRSVRCPLASVTCWQPAFLIWIYTQRTSPPQRTSPLLQIGEILAHVRRQFIVRRRLQEVSRLDPGRRKHGVVPVEDDERTDDIALLVGAPWAD